MMEALPFVYIPYLRICTSHSHLSKVTRKTGHTKTYLRHKLTSTFFFLKNSRLHCKCNVSLVTKLSIASKLYPGMDCVMHIVSLVSDFQEE